MKETIPFAFALWSIVALVLFRRCPAPRALAITYIGGWLLLPNVWIPGGYPEALAGMAGVALLSIGFITKASVLGFSALLAALVFAPGQILRLRPRWVDLPIILWTLVPVLSALANGLPITDGLTATAYHALAWTAPWILGRAYLTSPEALLDCARIFRNATLLYLPLALAELVVGPFLYDWLYGLHPYTTDGAVRYVAYRPMVFLEHGNQMGLWVALAAVAAFWIWRAERGTSKRPRAWMPTTILAAATLAFQSVGGILLMLVGLLAFPFGRLRHGRLALLMLAGVGILYISVRATGVVPLRTLAKETEIGRQAKALFEYWGRGSFGWRLNLEEIHLRNAWEKPILGQSEPDWWRESGRGRPWGLWILVFGQYGLIGLLTMTGTLLLPVFVLTRQKPSSHLRAPPWHGVGVLAVILALAFADSLLNSTLPLVLVAVAGGLSVAGIDEPKATARVERHDQGRT
jgi:hypothetical protein